jgi:glucosamine 6-phosphate synthetase-like amidotransferase/phosphosugar isomerase protein
MLEVVKKFGAVGYEMDDGLHGPNMGMTDKTRVIVLSDGVSDQPLAQGIARYVKNEVGTAYIVGKNVIDDSDFELNFVTENFLSLEFAPFVQLLSYRLAEYLGVEVPLFKDLVLPDQKYFNTHTEHLGK